MDELIGYLFFWMCIVLPAIYLGWGFVASFRGSGAAINPLTMFTTLAAATLLTASLLLHFGAEPEQGILILAGVLLLLIFILGNSQTLRDILKPGA